MAVKEEGVNGLNTYYQLPLVLDADRTLPLSKVSHLDNRASFRLVCSSLSVSETYCINRNLNEL